MFDLYLASQSSRRRELLQQIGVLFKVIPANVHEQPEPGEEPSRYVQRLAREKSMAGWSCCRSRALPSLPVLGADTLGEIDGQLLEKPRDRQDACDMLLAMSGREHGVLSAVAITSERGQDCLLCETRVRFRKLSVSEIGRYWNSGEPLDKAGAYAIQGFGALFVEHISGSYSSVVGLPLQETRTLLVRHGVPYWNTAAAGSNS